MAFEIFKRLEHGGAIRTQLADLYPGDMYFFSARHSRQAIKKAAKSLGMTVELQPIKNGTIVRVSQPSIEL